MSSAPSSTHILLTCGSWHSASIWDRVRTLLTSSSPPIPSTAILLPSYNASTYDMTEDVDCIRAETEKLCEAGRDVILVLHSYTGQPGSQAMKGLSKKERQAQGLRGGVVRLVFIMAWIVPEGFESAKRLEGGEPDWSLVPEWMDVDKEAGVTTVSPEAAKKILYNDLSATDADRWAAELTPWSIGCSFSKSTYAGWRVIPTTYVICEKDQSVFGTYAPMLLEQARANSPHMIDTVETVGTGHMPMIGKPELVADILKRAQAS